MQTRLHIRLAFLACLLALNACGTTSQIATTDTTEAEVTSTTIDERERIEAVRAWNAVELFEATQRWNATVEAIEAAEQAEREEAAARRAQETAPAPAVVSAPTSWFPADSPIPANLRAFFSCVKAHESGGNYGAVNPSGKYRGAYQADTNFFRSYAPPEWQHLAGVHETAPPAVQDAMALAGYRARGNGPWNGICSEYG